MQEVDRVNQRIHPNLKKILELVLDNPKPMNKTEIKEKLGFSYKNIHLNIEKLNRMGLLYLEKDHKSKGRQVYVYPMRAHIESFFDMVNTKSFHIKTNNKQLDEIALQLKRIADYLEPPQRSFLNERLKQ
jgi:predicted transcriptional regulator